jgi:hypothetical protein
MAPEIGLSGSCVEDFQNGGALFEQLTLFIWKEQSFYSAMLNIAESDVFSLEKYQLLCLLVHPVLKNQWNKQQ